MKKLFAAITVVALLGFSAKAFPKDKEMKDAFFEFSSDPKQINSRDFSIKHISYSRLCTLETRDDSPYTYVHTYLLDLSECRCITCDDNLANLKPIKEERFNWMTRTRRERFFKGAKKLTTGSEKFKSLSAKPSSTKTIFIEEYKKCIPMFWKLKNIKELKGLILFLSREFELHEIKPTEKDRPRLLIAIEDDENEESSKPLFDLKKSDSNNNYGIERIDLTNYEKTFLVEYFKLTLDEEGFNHPIRRHYRQMMAQLSKIREMNYPLVTDTLSQKLANGILENYKSVGIKEIIYTVIGIKILHFLNKIGSIFDNIVEKKSVKLEKEIDSLFS
jgi:hypothetical protein